MIASLHARRRVTVKRAGGGWPRVAAQPGAAVRGLELDRRVVRPHVRPGRRTSKRGYSLLLLLLLLFTGLWYTDSASAASVVVHWQARTKTAHMAHYWPVLARVVEADRHVRRDRVEHRLDEQVERREEPPVRQLDGDRAGARVSALQRDEPPQTRIVGKNDIDEISLQPSTVLLIHQRSDHGQDLDHVPDGWIRIRARSFISIRFVENLARRSASAAAAAGVAICSTRCGCARHSASASASSTTAPLFWIDAPSNRHPKTEQKTHRVMARVSFTARSPRVRNWSTLS